jgi:hypothetical protein
MKRILLLAVAACSVSACWEPALPGSAQSQAAASTVPARFVAVEPAQQAGVSPNSRFSFELPPDVAPEALRLYRGELSEYHQQRIAKAELPNTLLEREVPVMTWSDQAVASDAGTAQAVLSQAQGPLEPGERYSWALVGQGPLLSFQVGDAQPIGWRRLWPTEDSGFWGYAAYCKDPDDSSFGFEEGEASDWVFEPGAHRVRPQRGLGLAGIAEDRCLHLEVDDDPLPQLLVPPVMVAGSPLDPSPLTTKQSDPVLPVSCDAGGQALGPGCVYVQDDRVTVISPSSPSLWLLSAGELQRDAVAQGAFTVRGFTAGQATDLEFAVFLADGQRHRGQVRITTAPSRSHVVINEVLANPLGSEPGQEWLELYNDGSDVVDLQGWRVSDGTGESELPAATLNSGQYALVTSEQYLAGGSDVQFADETLVLRVATLGSNGLSNSGEEVRLLSVSGELQSRFPAHTASKGGVSIARVSPEAADDAEASFAPHGDPGASPGAANTF